MVDAVRSGQSRVLVLHGEAGIGKTALLDHACASASGCRVVRVTGIESEMELAFAGLHQLCAPLLDRLDDLPAPQSSSIATAFGLRPGPPPDRFIIGLAVLSLLAESAEEAPLVCVIDDAQWLDHVSARTLAFVGRRLLAERVALVLALRDHADGDGWDGLPELEVAGLDDATSRVLLDAAVVGPLDDRVRDRIVAETRGNPLALLELTRGLTAVELGGGFRLPDSASLASRIEQAFLGQLEALPVDVRRLLLVAAVEPVGDTTLLWRAVEHLGIGPHVAAVAAATGLVEFGVRVRFRHPLVRSAVCRTATQQQLQEAHRVLAEVIDPRTDPDRRAWHHGQAAAEPDESVAAELERAARYVRDRGASAAAATLLERATELTPDPARRGARALTAAEATFDVAAMKRTSALLEVAEQSPLDPLQRAQLDRLRAHPARHRFAAAAVPRLLDVARRLEPLDAALARETYLDVLGTGFTCGRFIDVDQMVRAAHAARATPLDRAAPRAPDLLLQGLATRITSGSEAAMPDLRRALLEFATEETSPDALMRWHWLAAPAAHELWDDDQCDRLTARAVAVARRAGLLTMLPIALIYRAYVCILAGRFTDATALLEEADTLNLAIGHPSLRYVLLLVASWEGDEERARDLAGRNIDRAGSRGEGLTVAFADYASAVLFNGLGRHDRALDAAMKVCAHADFGLFGWALPELVEAGVRTGRLDVAASGAARLSGLARAAGTPWARASAARSRALVADDEHADDLFREALDEFGRTRIRVDLARTHLLYGEWLRASGRPGDAKVQLRTAHDMTSEIGMHGFAERARNGLLAAGEKVRKRTTLRRDDLTSQELQIARLAREGRTNVEIGAELFISSRTVEWHLRKVFTKLDITSRAHLHRALPDDITTRTIA
jgi:DNA-binding CsgD family transcriptional regulator/tetratricopeptide (TPR) repeat protein